MKSFKDIREAIKSNFYRTLYRKQKGIFYRGEPKKGGRSGIGFGALGNGIYLTWEEGMANAYASHTSGVVNKYKVKNGLKIADVMGDDIINIKANLGFGPYDYTKDKFFNNALTFELKKLKYDGAISTDGAEGLVIFDDKDVKLQ